MRVLYYVANLFHFFSILMVWFFVFFCYSASCCLSLCPDLYFVVHSMQKRCLIKWRTLFIRSVWIRIITEWIIGVGLWVTSFRCWFIVWWSSSITFLPFVHPQQKQTRTMKQLKQNIKLLKQSHQFAIRPIFIIRGLLVRVSFPTKYEGK